MRLKREEWERHITRWRAGGKSAAAYCAAHDLKLSTLRYWTARLSKEKKAKSKAPAVGFARVRRRQTPSQAANVAPLRVLCGDSVVEVPSAFDAVALRRVLEVLRTTRAGR